MGGWVQFQNLPEPLVPAIKPVMPKMIQPCPIQNQQNWESILCAGLCLLLLPVAVFKWAKESSATFFKLIFFPGPHINEMSRIVTIWLSSIFIKYLLICINAMFSNDHSDFLASSYYLSETSLHARVCVCYRVREGETERRKKAGSGGSLNKSGNGAAELQA